MEEQHLLGKDLQSKSDIDAKSKSAYHPPRLIEWGTISELTESGGEGDPDGIAGSVAGGF